MKAWEMEAEILNRGIPPFTGEYSDTEKDNEQVWIEQSEGPELSQDAQTLLFWHSHVPGSEAEESICLAAVQATENKGCRVAGGTERILKGYELIRQMEAEKSEEKMAELHRLTANLFDACYTAEADENSTYWKQHFYDTFEEYAQAAGLSTKAETSDPAALMKKLSEEEFRDRMYAGWLAQIIGGAYGTCIEGYTADAIREKYGKADFYVRRPNTYNDDITYELALLEAHRRCGIHTSSRDIAMEWIARIPTGWSAEGWALNNLRCGILPPESGKFHNPFNEWIGAQMRGAVCGQLYPGELYRAARCAWMDASVSHARNGILGEVFNALLTAAAFTEPDMRRLVEQCIRLIPEDSEYGQVIRFALEQCRMQTGWYEAWKVCEKQYRRYNWIHAYPNACIEVIALWFGAGDFTETLSICGGCGQDVDCNAAQVMTVFGTACGSSYIPEYWKAPIGDKLNTTARGLKELSIKELAHDTCELAKKLVTGQALV